MNWISCHDRLPEDGIRVLYAILSTPSNARWDYSLGIAIYSKRDNKFRSDGRAIWAPAFWMPFPEPPPLPAEAESHSAKVKENKRAELSAKIQKLQAEIQAI